MTSTHLDNLNPPQLEAVQHHLGPILVLAGAGSGKTRVLTRRVANLVLEHGVEPRRILAVTFTNKATDEMRERLSHLLGERSRDLWIATFHSAGLRILRRNAHLLGFKNDFAVYDTQDSKNTLKQVLKEQGIDEKKFGLDLFTRAIDQAKNNYRSPEELEKEAKQYADRLVAQVYDQYQRALLKSNAMDFGDLLYQSLKILKTSQQVLNYYQTNLQFILVDEYQDTNHVQYEFVRLLAEPKRNILVVGDDDQSIYAFRGATIRNILEFEKDFKPCKVVTLEQNYRSTANVLDVANAVIEKNRDRKVKKLWTADSAGAPVHAFLAEDEGMEALYITREIRNQLAKGMKYSDIAIFYRTNAQSRALEESLSLAGIPYRIFGGLKFYDRKEIKDILGYLRVILNSSDTQSYLRVVNTPTRGVGAQAVQSVLDESRDQNSTIIEATRAIATRNKSLAGFIRLYDELAAKATEIPPSELIAEVLERTGYAKRLVEGKDVNAESRIENIQELISIAKKIESGAESPIVALRGFLDRVALTSGSDLPAEGDQAAQQANDGKNSVSLMTLHLAKGLEFPVVFFTGLEEGLVPHYRSLEDPKAIEEERRLCYVGITRARKELFLTRATQRGLFSASGGSLFREISRFAYDMPPRCLENNGEGFFESSSFEKDEDDVEFEVKESIQPNRSRLFRKQSLLSAVKPAEDLQPTGPLAPADSLLLGVKVSHPAFGVGIVEALEPDPRGDEKKLKLLVKFDSVQEPKKLVYRFAKLSLA